MALQYTPVLLSLTTGKQSASPLVLFPGAWLCFLLRKYAHDLLSCFSPYCGFGTLSQ